MKEKIDKNIIIRLVKLGLEYKFLFYLCLFVAILLSLISTYRPLFMGNVIDELITGKSKNSGYIHHYIQLLFPAGKILTKEFFLIIACSFIFLLIIIETVLQYYLVLISNNLAQNVIYKLRINLYQKLIKFKSAFFDRTPNGTLVTRSVSDIETISTVYNDGILLMFGDLLRIITILIFMFRENWQLALISFFIIPIMLIVTRIFQKAIKKAFTDERNFSASLNSFVQERLSGMILVQLFNRHKQENRKFNVINKDLNEANLRTVFYFSLFFPVVEVVSSIATGLVIFFGGKLAFEEHNISVGVIIAFTAFINMLMRPIRQIADRFNTIQRGFVGAERVFKLIDNEEIIDNSGKIKVEKFKGNIDFNNVAFSYIKGEEVLKGISFSVKQGQKVAIVGSTGAGKSTIINLLSRFYEIDSGKITIDGLEIKQYELSNLRNQISVVLQDVFLFNATLYENIILGNTDLTLEKVQKAAKEIGIDDFINQLPGSYNYVVSERGNSLSSGQKQTISFLRAYLHNPSILVLDEATSSIDTYSEELIQKATDKLTENRSSIIIAHRLSTIQNADTILVMENGKIIEQGNHTELVSKNGFYKELYEIQFKN